MTRASRYRRTLVLHGILACLFLAAGLFLYSIDEPGKILESPPSLSEEMIENVGAASGRQAQLASNQYVPSPQTPKTIAAPAQEKVATKGEAKRVPDAGYVSVADTWGYVISEVPSVVVDSGWIALPTRAVVGGGNWLFRAGAGREAGFAGGLWQQGDDVGIWQLDNDKAFVGAPLAAWDPTKPLTWTALDGSAGSAAVPISTTEVQGFFLHADLPETFKGAALLLQEDKVVGWSFGDLLPGAYLWNGALETVHVYEATVADFYNQTFAGGREEQFAYGLALDERTPALTRLAAFADAFVLPPKLLEEDTPNRLRKTEIIPYLRYFAGLIDNRKEAVETVKLFPVSMLLEIGDPLFSAVVARLAADGFGQQYAIDLLTQVIAYFQKFPAARTAELRSLHLNLYRNLINLLLKENQLAQAQMAYGEASRLYPEDAGLYLIGVDLAVAGEDWQAAEQLLNARTYPAQFIEKEKLLRASIAALKGREGKIVIEFYPGHSVIPTSARLDGYLRQNFLVDTGASFVTIPSATARQLGIRVTDANPRQIVFTAGGTFTAPEIVIPSIELGGWIVDDVRALVLDIPNQGDTGLLGLNFLNRFQMDLDTENGILLLSPK